jgi:hypothetical protein
MTVHQKYCGGAAKGIRIMKKLFFLFALSFFTLIAAAEDPNAYRVLVLGDVHYDRTDLHTDPDLAKKRNLAMWKRATPALLAYAGELAKTESAAFVIQLGDLTQGYAGTPELQRQMLTEGVAAVKKYFPETPLLIVRGNHDVSVLKGTNDDRSPADAVLIPATPDMPGLKKSAKNGNYSVRKGRDLFIAVDGFLPAQEVVGFVKETLDANPDARYVFLLTHLPVLPASAKTPFWLLPGHYEIAELLETRQALILAAHTHIPSLACRATGRGKLPQLVVSSMGNRWSPDRLIAPNITSWEEFVEAGKTVPQVGWNKKNRKRWPVLNAKGKYEFRQLFLNGGCVLLRVDDDGCTVEYRNGGDQPAYVMRLPQK